MRMLCVSVLSLKAACRRRICWPSCVAVYALVEDRTKKLQIARYLIRHRSYRRCNKTVGGGRVHLSGECDYVCLHLHDYQRRVSSRHRSKPNKDLSTEGIVRKLLLSCIESTRMAISFK